MPPGLASGFAGIFALFCGGQVSGEGRTYPISIPRGTRDRYFPSRLGKRQEAPPWPHLDTRPRGCDGKSSIGDARSQRGPLSRAIRSCTCSKGSGRTDLLAVTQRSPHVRNAIYSLTIRREGVASLLEERRQVLNLPLQQAGREMRDLAPSQSLEGLGTGTFPAHWGRGRRRHPGHPWIPAFVRVTARLR